MQQPRPGTAKKLGRYGALRQQLRARRWWHPDLRPNLAALQALLRQPKRTWFGIGQGLEILDGIRRRLKYHQLLQALAAGRGIRQPESTCDAAAGSRWRITSGFRRKRRRDLGNTRM